LCQRWGIGLPELKMPFFIGFTSFDEVIAQKTNKKRAQALEQIQFFKACQT
jgi:hypothetical protein